MLTIPFHFRQYFLKLAPHLPVATRVPVSLSLWPLHHRCGHFTLRLAYMYSKATDTSVVGVSPIKPHLQDPSERSADPEKSMLPRTPQTMCMAE
jgi:hypothetical protein